jgi:hypothetical protein
MDPNGGVEMLLGSLVNVQNLRVEELSLWEEVVVYGYLDFKTLSLLATLLCEDRYLHWLAMRKQQGVMGLAHEVG